jgi:hypothetical protein
MRLRRRFAWFYVRLDLPRRSIQQQAFSLYSLWITCYSASKQGFKPPKPNPIDVAMKYI